MLCSPPFPDPRKARVHHLIGKVSGLQVYLLIGAAMISVLHNVARRLVDRQLEAP